MSLMLTIFCLILVNFLVALARLQQRVWLRVLLFVIAFITLLLAILFGLRALSV
jgi:hypothetical protein